MEPIDWIRPTFFVVGFFVFAMVEQVAPWRGIVDRPLRWVKHFAVIAVGTVLVRLLFFSGAVGASVWAANHQVGISHWLGIPLLVECIVSVIALDCLIYWQHRLFHTLPWLWRLHRFHHEDVQLDVSSALRFHPIEIVLSMAIKMLAVVALGASIWAVIVFEVLLNLVAMFNHADWKLPASIEKQLRRLIVTPDMHRVHHSVASNDMQRNFGFNLSVWDRMFGSYRPQQSGESVVFGVLENK